MTPLILGDGVVADDLNGLLSGAGLMPVRIKQPEQISSDGIAGCSHIFDATGFSPERKREVFRFLAETAPRDAIVLSDESVVTRQELIAGIDPIRARQFAICHFFIPTAKLKLVELVCSPDISPAVGDRIDQPLTGLLGRTIVRCPDTPGFIANRLGLFFTVLAVLRSLENGLRPDQTDRVLFEEFGTPRLGAFGLIDLIGLEVLISIGKAIQKRLPSNDAWQSCAIDGLAKLRPTSGGPNFKFYQKDKSADRRKVFDPYERTFVVADKEPSDILKRSKFVTQLRSEFIPYCNTVSDLAGLEAVSIALRQGFGWQTVLFE